jgi:hypothetical protein
MSWEKADFEIKSLKGKIGDVELDFPDGTGNGSIKIDGNEISHHVTSLTMYVKAGKIIKINMMLDCLKLEDEK